MNVKSSVSTLYKLTDQNGYTRQGRINETLWGPSTTHTASGSGGLCTDGVIHAYEHPLIALMFNNQHANLDNPKLWRAKGIITHTNKHQKVGVKTLTTTDELSIPSNIVNILVECAIECALTVYKEPLFVVWADSWKAGNDRTARAADYAAAARAADYAADYATRAATRAADYADYAAHAADYAARAAACAADYAAYAAAHAATYAATRAADYAGDYADYAAAASFNLLAIVEMVSRRHNLTF